MEQSEYIAYIKSAFERNLMSDLIDGEKAEMFFCLSGLLVETNKITNLTAITDEKDIILKHFIDCAAITRFIPKSSTVIDVGCGAGFPSLPLAICRPDLEITSLDSTGKKIDFVDRAIDVLGLEKSLAVCARAEEFVSQHREKYNVCVSRAVARLNILSELCLPLVTRGGSFIAMKSNKGEDELDEARQCITLLGGEHSKTDKLTLSSDCASIEREIQLFTKVKPTPTRYPRKYAQMLKRPL